MRNPNGYGAIINLGKNRRKPWAIRVTVGYEDMKQKYQYIGYYASRKEAIIALASYNENPYSIDHDKLTFKDIYDRWKVKGLEGLAKTSQTTYTGAYKHCAAIYDIKFKTLSTTGLQKVIDSIDAPTSKHGARLLFNQLYKYALKNDIVQKDYSKLIDVKKPTTQKARVPFTDDEIKLLWDNIELENMDILLILIYTGFRINELLEVEKENIFLKERYIIGGKKTTAGKKRVVPIHKKILPFVEKRMKEKHLFSGKKGGKLLYDNFLKYYFNPFMEDLKMTHFIHDTRHTFITKLDSVGVDKLTIKKLAGHASADVTDRYTHKNIKLLTDAVDTI